MRGSGRPWSVRILSGHLSRYGTPVFHDGGDHPWRWRVAHTGEEFARWTDAVDELRKTRPDATEKDLDRLERATCGLVIEERRAGRDYDRRSSVYVRTDLAELFARPCRRCWPEGPPWVG